MAGKRGSRWTYFFGYGKADGRGDQKELLGGKGAGLAEMTRIGLPVPAGFTITTQACAAYHEQGGKWPGGLEKEVRGMLVKLERACRKKFGDAKDPLLVSVRSGAARSMPGMMETILNLGLNDKSVEGLAQASGNRRFALDAYRRLISMYGSTAHGLDRRQFDQALEEIKSAHTRGRVNEFPGDKALDTDMNEDELLLVVERFKRIYEQGCGEPFPQDPFAQLKGAVSAVFNSWNAEKAVTYRRVEGITDLNGTAVNVCRMVFGNLGDDSGTGVCFTRDPSTGEATFYGDLLINAQGEDVVAGVRNPLKLDELKRLMPDVYDQLDAVRVMLETHYRDMQDMEFTIERGKLYLLQTRIGKRSAVAAFKIAVDQATRGMVTGAQAQRLVKKKYLPARYAKLATKPILTRQEAIARIQPGDIERLFYPVVDPQVPAHQLNAQLLAEGIGAVPGAASGAVVFTADEAERRAAQGLSVLLLRKETSPEDVGGMHVAAGILTATGGKTSHAAVVARGWGKCCIVGCEALSIDETHQFASINGRSIRQGETLTLDGTTGRVYLDRLPLTKPEAPPEYDILMGWCDQARRMEVRANADTPEDATHAVKLGAEGIGLCRTEHMFFEAAQPERLTAMREMILAEDEESRKRALDQLLPFQREDFEGVFTAMNGRPVTIRLLDPPLHEFLPQPDNVEALRAIVEALNRPRRDELARVPVWDYARRREMESRFVSIDQLRRRVDMLREANPMLGHRGCRLCITFPEILDTQVRAIIEAAVNCSRRGIRVLPEIMIPLSMDGKELAWLIDRARFVADAVLKEQKAKIHYLLGTMVETPRAALLAGQLARASEFFSFGTNDLTQMTMGLSRDDAGRFLPHYLSADRGNILPADPFQVLDRDGVGVLMRQAIEKGKSVRRDLKIGICGEHGGDPDSIRFCEELMLDYVSCSPPRVPVARLAAAQAAIALKRAASTRSKGAAKSAGGSAKARAVRSGSKATGKKNASRKAKSSGSANARKGRPAAAVKMSKKASKAKKSPAEKTASAAKTKATRAKSKSKAKRRAGAKTPRPELVLV